MQVTSQTWHESSLCLSQVHPRPCSAVYPLTLFGHNHFQHLEYAVNHSRIWQPP